MKKMLCSAPFAVYGLGYSTFYYNYPELASLSNYNSTLLRIFRLSFCGGKMAYIYKTNQDEPYEQKHDKASLILQQAFEKNGGIYLKFGQILATLEVIVPEQYRKNLSIFYMQNKKSSEDDVKYIIEKNANKKIEEIFESFDKEPISSASIAQVHKATLKGSHDVVAVKVQHRYLQETIPLDVALLEVFIAAAKKLFPEFNFDWLASELKKNIYKEIDFEMEKNNLKKTAKLFKGKHYIKIPNVYDDLCFKQLLTMEFVEAKPLQNIDLLVKEGYNIQEISENLTKIFAKQIFKYGFIHADPHPGNIHVRKVTHKGKTINQIVLFDHGLYKEITNDLRKWYSVMWKGILLQKEDYIKIASKNMGIEKDYETFATMISHRSYEMILEKKNRNNTYKRFGTKHTEEDIQRIHSFALANRNKIVKCLQLCNPDLLLLFKTNDFLSSINQSLGCPVDSYYYTSKYAILAAKEYEKELKRGWVANLKDYIRESILKCFMKFAKLTNFFSGSNHASVLNDNWYLKLNQ